MQFKTTDIPQDIVKLWSLADELWELKQNETEFESYASADYYEVFCALKSLQGRATTFLELGSGLGIVTIMAAWLGFESYGIEAREPLVDQSRSYARQLSVPAHFATGSFIPGQFQWDPAQDDDPVKTFVDEFPAYDDLGMDLDDFDLIYAYPWPTEHRLYERVLGEFARPDALYLSYDAREGIRCRPIDYPL